MTTSEPPLLSDQNLDRIRATWSLAMSDPARTSTLFYSTLFRLDPSTKPLFVGDLELQGRKLIQTLAFIVDHLDDLETLLPAAHDLAISHVSFGVTADQYDTVGAALITTLQKLLGAGFTPHDTEIWTDVYTVLATHMVRSAYGPDPAYTKG